MHTENKDKIRRLKSELQSKYTADFHYLIDIVGTCNLRCPSCAVGNYTEAVPKGMMSLETFNLICDKIKAERPNQTIFLHLYNWGEPTLHKDLGKIITEAKQRGFKVGISTNLNHNFNIKDVVESNPDYIRISLSGFFNHTYQITHRRGNIFAVKANMYLLRYWIDKAASQTIVTVGFHIYRHNFPDDFQRMRELSEELLFIFEPILALFTPLEKVRSIDAGGAIEEEDQKVLDLLVVPLKQRISNLQSVESGNNPCWFQEKFFTINWDTSVSLCCATYDKNQLIADSFLDMDNDSLQKKKITNSFCETCISRRHYQLFTAAPDSKSLADAIQILGPEYEQYLSEEH